MDIKLSKTQKKLLKLIVKNNRIRLCEVYNLKYFKSINIPEEADFLMKQGFITINKSSVTYEPTIQGKHFFEGRIKDWIFENILAILALIVSIIALFN